MPATDNFESELLNLIFLNDNIANIGDATGVRGASTAGSFYISLHEGALADTNDDQADNETGYTGYQRKAIARSGAAWTVSATSPTQVANDSAITFGESSDGPFTITDFGLGHASSGVNANSMFIYGSLTSNLVINNGITPEFASSALVITVT